MSLVHWWPLDGDVQDKMNGTSLTNTGATIVASKLGKGYSFNGNTNLKQTYANTLNTSTISAAFWIKLNSTWSGYGQVLLIGREGNSWSDIRFGVDIDNNRWAYFSVSNGNSSVQTNGCQYQLELNTWYHIVATYDNGEMIMYVNGAATSSSPYTTSIVPNINSGSTVIAIGGNADEKGECDMCDVRLYDHALSSKEVLALSQGLMLHYNFDNMAGTTNVFTGIVGGSKYTTVTGGIQIDWTSSKPDTHFGIGPYGYSTPTPNNTEFILSFNCSGLTVENKEVFYISNRTELPIYLKNGYNVVRFNTATLHTLSETRLFLDDSNLDLKGQKFTLTNFALMRVDQCSDGSGYNRNGKLNQIASSTTSATGDRAAYFNGNYSYIEMNNWKPNLPNEDYTVSFWINPSDSDIRDIIFGNHNASSSSFNIERYTSNQLRIYYSTDTPGLIASATMPANIWTHIVIVRSGSNVQVWKNGTSVSNQAYTLPTLSCTNAKWKIGSDYREVEGTAHNTRFKGYLDDFRIYATALKQADIEELYRYRFSANQQGQAFSNMLNATTADTQFSPTGTTGCSDIYEVRDLPVGYTPLTYIESTGTQYIDTGVSRSNTDELKMQITFQYYPSQNGTNGIMGQTGNRGMGIGTNTGPTWWECESMKNQVVWNKVNVMEWTVKGGAYTRWINGERIVQDTGASNTTLNCYLFAAKASLSSSNMSYFCKGRMYGTKMYKNGALVRDFIPCQTTATTPVVGLYDKVNNVFYANNGTGTFIPGPFALSLDQLKAIHVTEYHEE